MFLSEVYFILETNGKAIHYFSQLFRSVRLSVKQKKWFHNLAKLCHLPLYLVLIITNNISFLKKQWVRCFLWTRYRFSLNRYLPKVYTFQHEWIFFSLQIYLLTNNTTAYCIRLPWTEQKREEPKTGIK